MIIFEARPDMVGLGEGGTNETNCKYPLLKDKMCLIQVPRLTLSPTLPLLDVFVLLPVICLICIGNMSS